MSKALRRSRYEVPQRAALRSPSMCRNQLMIGFANWRKFGSLLFAPAGRLTDAVE